MKRKDVTEAFYYNTQTVSNIVRGLGLSGIALVWLFRVTDADGNHLLGEFWPALCLFLATLFFDLAQYVVAAQVWGYWDARFHSERKGPNADVEVPSSHRRLQVVCYWLKIGCTVIGYGFFFSAAYGPLKEIG